MWIDRALDHRSPTSAASSRSSPEEQGVWPGRTVAHWQPERAMTVSSVNRVDDRHSWFAEVAILFDSNTRQHSDATSDNRVAVHARSNTVTTPREDLVVRARDDQ